eukprot:6196556-Pleurochrysis_carterae.AAC.1
MLVLTAFAAAASANFEATDLLRTARGPYAGDLLAVASLDRSGNGISAAAAPVSKKLTDTNAETVDRLVVCYARPLLENIFCRILIYTCTLTGDCQLSSGNKVLSSSSGARSPTVVVISGQPAVVYRNQSQPAIDYVYRVMLRGMVANADGSLETKSFEIIHKSTDPLDHVQATSEFQIPTLDALSIDLQDDAQNQGVVCWSKTVQPYVIGCKALGGPRLANGNMDIHLGTTANVASDSVVGAMSYLTQDRLARCHSTVFSSDGSFVCKYIAIEGPATINHFLVPTRSNVQLIKKGLSFSLLSSTSLLLAEGTASAICYIQDDDNGQEEIYCAAIVNIEGLSDDGDDDDDGLSGGAIAATVIGSLVGVVLVAALVAFFVLKKQGKQPAASTTRDNVAQSSAI